MLIVAIDWSGAKAGGGRRDIAIAECVDGELCPLRLGMSRDEVRRWLLNGKSESDEMIVGLDFAFSLPAWFAHEVLCAQDVTGIWDAVARDGDAWLAGSAPWPFWGRGPQAGSTSLPPELAFRQTELDVATLTATRPKSVFQLVGSGQVGPGSLRGMPLLQELRAAGFAVWPFDDFALPLVIEIYPRVLTGDVTKSRLEARVEYLAGIGGLSERVATLAAASENTFDAACSALVMSRRVESIEQLRREPEPYAVEGKIWAPTAAVRPRRPTGGVARSMGIATDVGARSDSRPSVLNRARPATTTSIAGSQRMVRVMRKHVAGLDTLTSEQLAERVSKLEALQGDPAHMTMRSVVERKLRAYRRALEPDFANSKVHHVSNCWFVDAYEEGRFPGGAKRKFVMVPVDSVPENVSGCQFCESGRSAAIKLRETNAPSSSAPAAPPRMPGSIQVGSIVDVLDLGTGEAHHWTIVQPAESDPALGRISVASPVGKALVGHVPGETIHAGVPTGTRLLRIVQSSAEGG